MPRSLRTEAIVLRSIRYGEADRILHLYTPGYGRLSAIAKGARRARSRFGARLEPFFHIRAILHEGRSELHTVTGVDTVAAHAGLREHAATIDAAGRACDAVARLFETPDPHPEVFCLLANELTLLDLDVTHARAATGSGRAPDAASQSTCGASPPPPAESCAAPAKRPRSHSGRNPTPSWSARSADRSLRRPRHPSWRWRRRSARSPRPPNTTRTCGCGRSSAGAEHRRPQHAPGNVTSS